MQVHFVKASDRKQAILVLPRPFGMPWPGLHNISDEAALVIYEEASLILSAFDILYFIFFYCSQHLYLIAHKSSAFYPSSTKILSSISLMLKDEKG